jgi:DNA-directed RNA polymerase specialized sigma24 family protein
MNPIHPSSVPVPPPPSRNPGCRPPSSREVRRRRRKARLRCRLSPDERARFKESHYRAALGFACRYGVLDPGTVVAAAMEESLRVFRKRKGKFKALLFKILRWRLASVYRQESRRRIPCVPLSGKNDVIMARESVGEELVEVQSAFLSAWHDLAPVERQLLRLHSQGYTFPEIQRTRAFHNHGWVVASLRAKAHRALLKLRSRLRRFSDVPEEVRLGALESIPLAASVPRHRLVPRRSALNTNISGNAPSLRNECNR